MESSLERENNLLGVTVVVSMSENRTNYSDTTFKQYKSYFVMRAIIGGPMFRQLPASFPSVPLPSVQRRNLRRPHAPTSTVVIPERAFTYVGTPPLEAPCSDSYADGRGGKLPCRRPSGVPTSASIGPTRTTKKYGVCCYKGNSPSTSYTMRVLFSRLVSGFAMGYFRNDPPNLIGG